MAHLYLAVMVELLATLADVTYVTGNTTSTSPLLSTIALVCSSFVSRLQYEMITRYYIHIYSRP